MIPRRHWHTPDNGLVYEAFFNQGDRRYNLPVGLLSRVAYQESRYNPDAVSPAGAHGLMQIVPRWHPGVDPFDPIAAIDYAGGYLRQNLDRFNGDMDKALAAYNWGPGNVTRAVNNEGERWLTVAPSETRNYVVDVTRDVGIGAPRRIV